MKLTKLLRLAEKAIGKATANDSNVVTLAYALEYFRLGDYKKAADLAKESLALSVMRIKY